MGPRQSAPPGVHRVAEPQRATVEAEWNPSAAVAAWLLPGLGHYFLGERRRGLILACSIGAVWLGGLVIGGTSVINRKEHPAWFVGQMLAAPSILIDLGGQFGAQRHPDSSPDNAPAFEPSFGHMYEQGILYTALAGLLNLLAISDVAYRIPGARAGGPVT